MLYYLLYARRSDLFPKITRMRAAANFLMLLKCWTQLIFIYLFICFYFFCVQNFRVERSLGMISSCVMRSSSKLYSGWYFFFLNIFDFLSCCVMRVIQNNLKISRIKVFYRRFFNATKKKLPKSWNLHRICNFPL